MRIDEKPARSGSRQAAMMVGLTPLILLGSLAAAQATYKLCPGISGNTGDKVVVGDLVVAPGTDPGAARIAHTRLRNAMWQRLSDLAASEGSEIQVTECVPGHQPEKAEFQAANVQDIFASGVVLEVWAVTTAQDAQINYALVPLFPPIGQGQNPDGYYELVYSIGPQAGLDKVFGDSLELRAFTMLGAGLRALDEAKVPNAQTGYGKAYSVLCRAYDLLTSAEQHPGGAGVPTTEWRALKSLALSSANAAAAKAAAPQGVTLGNCAVPAPTPVAETPP